MFVQFPELYTGTTGKINNAVEPVVKEWEEGEEDVEEEEGKDGGEEYSDNFEDARSPEELDTEQTEEPQRPSAPVCHTPVHKIVIQERDLCFACSKLKKFLISLFGSLSSITKSAVGIKSEYGTLPTH